MNEKLEIPTIDEQVRMVEALLFASSEPISAREITERLPKGSDGAMAVRELAKLYESRGVNIVRAGSGWAFRTAPDLGFLLRKQAVESRKLSRAGLETLAIIAYHQPVTRVEIEEIRGVSVSRGTLDTLMEMEWIKLGPRRETPGRPATFELTDRFLDHFGLASAKDLPGLDELKAAGLLNSRTDTTLMDALGTPINRDDDIEGEIDEEDEF